MKIHYSTFRGLLSFGIILGISCLLTASSITFAQAPPPPPGGIELYPVAKDECYAVTNESTGLGTYTHDYYNEYEILVYSFNDQVPALETKTYSLAGMPIPPGIYRIIIQADVPFSASKVSCSEEIAPNSVSISGSTTGETDTAYTFTANVSPSTTTLPVTYLWQATEQSPVTHTSSGLSDTINFTWSSPGTKVIDVTASNVAGNTTDNHTIIISITDTTPPAIDNIQKSSEYVNKQGCATPNTITFRADVTDSSGLAWVRLYYQPPGEVWAYTTMSLEAGNTYKATIGPFNQIGKMPYYIKARDNFNNPKALSVDYIPVACISISHVEVIQVTQNITNSVPLIAEKPTLVRVYVDCGAGCESLPNVTGILRGIGPSGELPNSPHVPDNPITANHEEDWANQRDDLTKTLNFKLPTSWLTETITLQAEIGGEVSGVETSFQPAQTIEIIHVPIRYKGQDPGEIDRTTQWFLDVYPTAKIRHVPGDVIEWDLCLKESILCLPGIRARNAAKLLNELTTKYRLIFENPYIYVFGWLPNGTYGGGVSDPTWFGEGDFEGAGRAAVGDNHPYEGWGTVAHEIGHLMGRHHTNTVDNLDYPDSCQLRKGNNLTDEEKAIVDTSEENDWPYDTSRVQEYGLQWPNYIHRPDWSFDYMSYCGFVDAEDKWTSPWTYEHIYSETLKIPSTTTVSSIQPFAMEKPYFIASGLVYTDDTVNLDPVWVITTTTPSNNPPIGTEYCFEAQDISDIPLANHCFDLTFVDYVSGKAVNVDGFNIMLPYPAGVARVVLKKGEQELAIQAVSANSPQVTITSPNGGETWSADGLQQISWLGSDSDGDILTYRVLYSPDGSSWVPISNQTTDSQITVDASEIAGGNGAKIRVLATDGINTSSDDSDASFTVGSKGPQVYIISPGEDTSISSGTALYLQGSAYDLEDGTLDESVLNWNSDLDGDLGTGSLVLANLSQGAHIVKLIATDSNNNSGTAIINVSVGFDEVYLPIILK